MPTTVLPPGRRRVGWRDQLNRFASQIERQIDRFRDGVWQSAPDAVAVEEPLEIRLQHWAGGELRTESLSVTMRTPGHDFELAAGLLFGEGIVSSKDDIGDVAHVHEDGDDEDHGNIVVVRLRKGIEVKLENHRRNFTTSSACGVCGKASLDALIIEGCRPLKSTVRIGAAALTSLPGQLREQQCGFEATGGVHAAGLFTVGCEPVALGEDVGRHNAFDKLVGGQLLAGSMDQLGEMVVVLSGRASYELLQKALRARIPIVASVGAPSSLAVEIAETFGITLAGFVKRDSFNVYAGRERVQ